jgi:hypothetical protein
VQEEAQNAQAGCCSAAAGNARDAATTAAIAGLVADVNALAYRWVGWALSPSIGLLLTDTGYCSIVQHLAVVSLYYY